VFFCDDDIVKSSAGPKFAMYFTVTPIAERTSIVESQRPELLPLDLQAELHLRSDRTAIAYRKWLKQLGLTFGTA
jgi:hypothetical protein